jgi:hypothetical protein
MGPLTVIIVLIVLLLLIAVAVGGAYFYVTRLGRIPVGHVGVVHRHIPGNHPDKFDVRLHKSAGPQADLLRANRHYWRIPLLYTVEPRPMVRVPPGTIGVVNALVGEPCPPGQKCKSVPCDNFQDARAFLEGGGQSGRQLDFLTAGVYGIHPYVFEVLTVDNIGEGKHGLTAADLREISIPVGHTGVVIALAGEAPDDADGTAGRRVPGHENFQLASVFVANGGQRGAQEQTLAHGGVYQINPWFARVARIPTRDVLLEWTSKKKPLNNYDTSLDQIAINIEGHRIRFNMTQVIRIPAHAAPGLVGRFGEQEEDVYGSSNATDGAPVRRFVERVLGSTVETYFQVIAMNYTVLDFFDQFDDVRLDLEDRVREALADWGVEAVRTTLSDFKSEDNELDAWRRQIATARDRQVILKSEHGNALIEKETRVIQADADAYAATAPEVRLLQEQIRLLTQDHVKRERYLKWLTQMKVPEVVAGDAAQLLQYMPLNRALEIISRAQDRAAEPGVEAAAPPELPEAEAEY